MITVQTRSEETGLNQFNSIKEAMEAAHKDSTIWKVSFSVGNERVRLIKQVLRSSANVSIVWWKYEPIMEGIFEGR